MQQWFENLDWKKIGILLVIIFLITAPLVFWLLTFQNKKPLVSSKTISRNEEKISPSPTPKEQNSSESANWKVYSNLFFKISYPPNFTVSDGVLPDEGTSTVLLSPNEKILIETFNSQVMPSTSVINGFTSMGYGQSQVNLGSIRATAISGSRLNIMSEKGYIFESGGGVVVNKIVGDYLKENGYTIYLRVSFNEAKRRLREFHDRPNFRDPRVARHLYDFRKALYRAYADDYVRTDGKAPEEIVQEIIELVKEME